MVIPFQIIYGVFFGTLLLILFLWSRFNKFVKMKVDIGAALSNIEIQLKLRSSLVDNLVEVVKGYAEHEKSTLVDTAKARNVLEGTISVATAQEAQGIIDAGMHSLFAIAENYPELKADKHYSKLMNELKSIESKIATYREMYNMQVGKYNRGTQTFPGLIAAGLFGFKSAEFFDKDK
jgi:LemA protein